MKFLYTFAVSVFSLLIVVDKVYSDEKVDFVKQIKPILESKCVECHGPEDPEGEFSLNTKVGAMKGGADGKSIIPGKAAESKLFELITLENDDSLRMPMEGDPLSNEQIQLIKRWINEGANWPDDVSLNVPDTGEPARPQDPLNTPGLPITDGEKQAVEQAEKLGALVLRIVQDSNWLQVDFSLQGKEVKDLDLALVQDMANLVELDLGGTKITDAGLTHLQGLKELRRLHLENTAVTDVGLSHIANLEKLKYLNLYGTKVTDKGIAQLKGLRNLEKLYLWQTGVTQEGATALKNEFTDEKLLASLQEQMQRFEEELKKLTDEKQVQIRAVKRQIAGLAPEINLGLQIAAAKKDSEQADPKKDGEPKAAEKAKKDVDQKKDEQPKADDKSKKTNDSKKA